MWLENQLVEAFLKPATHAVEKKNNQKTGYNENKNHLKNFEILKTEDQPQVEGKQQD